MSEDLKLGKFEFPAGPTADAASAAEPQECCGSCYFSCPNKANIQGMSCRAEPPRLFMIPTGPGRVEFRSVFPPVDRKEWCGRWKPRMTNGAG